MELYNTRFCFVTAHLAAGFANYDERNRDYATISHGLLFQKDCGIDDHDVVIWFGDFNYRIGLTNESAKKLIDAGDLDTLYSNDQVTLSVPYVNIPLTLTSKAQFTNDRGSRISFLFGRPNMFSSNVQVRHRKGCV